MSDCISGLCQTAHDHLTTSPSHDPPFPLPTMSLTIISSNQVM
uniref:Uncharacterized protein n=1 Tax=Anguilla anguilla TaxID=7936 RepID=A0A0E9VD21_ANGAN